MLYLLKINDANWPITIKTLENKIFRNFPKFID